MAALDDRPRPGKEPTITGEAGRWLVSLACRKAKNFGYPHELWTTPLLARHAREHGPAEGHACLGKLILARCARSSMSKRSSRTRCATTWNAATPSSKPRWRKFCASTARSRSRRRPHRRRSRATRWRSSPMTRSPGIQAIATDHPDLPPEPGAHATFARDHEYKRYGTVSLLAGIDLITGAVHALIPDHHPVTANSSNSSSFSTPPIQRPHGDQADPRRNHTAHHFPRKPKLGSPSSPPAASNSPSRPSTAPGFNLVAGFFSKLFRFRTAPHQEFALKQELKQRVIAAIDQLQSTPLLSSILRSYKLDQAA